MINIKGVAFLLLIVIIVLPMIACYFLERAANLKRLAHPQKKDLGPGRLDEYRCSIHDKKINELLLAKHHEPIHPNLFWLLLIPACLFASPALAQGAVGHTAIFSEPAVIILFILIMLAAMVKRPVSIQATKNQK